MVLNRVLVTGGAGFIGGVVVRRLLDKGWSVSVVDDFSTGNWVNLPKSSNLKVFVKDVSVKHGLTELFAGVDVVVHLAAIPSVPACDENVHRAFEVNVVGLENVVEACLENGVGKIVFTSSAAVYGDAEGVLREETPVRPMSVYGWTKLMDEELLRSFSEKRKIDAVVLRVFNVYGRTGSAEMAGVVDRFIADAMAGRPLRIFGDGKQVRDFIHVNDVAEAVVRAVEREQNGYEVFNIGTGQPITIQELAEKILTAFGQKTSNIMYERPRTADIRHSVADIEKAKQKLGFKPSTELTKYIDSRVKGSSV